MTPDRTLPQDDTDQTSGPRGLSNGFAVSVFLYILIVACVIAYV